MGEEDLYNGFYSTGVIGSPKSPAPLTSGIALKSKSVYMYVCIYIYIPYSRGVGLSGSLCRRVICRETEVVGQSRR